MTSQRQRPPEHPGPQLYHYQWICVSPKSAQDRRKNVRDHLRASLRITGHLLCTTLAYPLNKQPQKLGSGHGSAQIHLILILTVAYKLYYAFLVCLRLDAQAIRVGYKLGCPRCLSFSSDPSAFHLAFLYIIYTATLILTIVPLHYRLEGIF